MKDLSVRLLIANHVDQPLLSQPDQRTFVQRLFWLVQEGDIIVVPYPPDEMFLDHVFTLLNVRKERVTILVAPFGRYEGRLFDPLSLISPCLINQLELMVKGCSELLCLWPSVQVAELAIRLNIEKSMPGARFFRQGGDALANSKATFRAYAAASGTPIPKGSVCRSIEELEVEISVLLKHADGVMIKQSYNAAAAGCTVIRKNKTINSRAAGSIWCDDVSELKESLHFLWSWGSVDNRFPVIVEELITACQTVWFEFKADDSGVTLLASGGLEYDDGKLVREHTPLTWDIPQEVLSIGLEAARRLAEFYQMSGYRGHLSADGIVDQQGKVLFTEMNARIGGSLPIYGGIWERVVRTSNEVDRHIVQYLTPRHWPNISTEKVLERLSKIGVLYNSELRTGAILGIPPHSDISGGSFLLTLVTQFASEQHELFARIDEEFS